MRTSRHWRGPQPEDFHVLAAVNKQNAQLRAALGEIREMAIKYGVNDEVGAAIAHAEVVARAGQPSAFCDT